MSEKSVTFGCRIELLFCWYSRRWKEKGAPTPRGREKEQQTQAMCGAGSGIALPMTSYAGRIRQKVVPLFHLKYTKGWGNLLF